VRHAMLGLGLALIAGRALAAPANFDIDPNHTFPSFETDHMGGMSIWRGKFRSTSGTVTLDTSAHSGRVDITVDTDSIDFGLAKMETHAKGPDMFDADKFPKATYKGRLTDFHGDSPGTVDGELTLHGVTHPLKLAIRSFKCQSNPMTKKYTCGADAAGEFDRSAYGIDFGKGLGFNMTVKLAIQVEAIRTN
jgi:polyisoprenoid-binding protein YceI